MKDQICARLKAIKIKDCNIDLIEYSGDASFHMYEQYQSVLGEKSIENIPPFFRICLSIRPAPMSCIHAEVCIPDESWNGRFLGIGNGGAGEMIWPNGMVAALRCNYACAAMDLGTNPNIDKGIGVPDIWDDYGWRATHLATVAAKELIVAIKGILPQFSYFLGSSTGGQQGLMEAQRFPEDYDGILAKVPGNNRVFLHTFLLWLHRLVYRQGKPYFKDAELEELNKIVVDYFQKRGDGAPGDTFVSDPRLEQVDMEELLMNVKKSGHFSEEQILILQKLYEGPVNPCTGEQIYCGYTMSALKELNDTGSDEAQILYQFPFRWCFGEEFDANAFDFDKDLEEVSETLASKVNANSPILDRYKARGGKIIMVSGAHDACVPFAEGINYYERVIEKQGSLEEARSFFRYFIIPGYGHGYKVCGGVDWLGEHIEQINYTNSVSAWCGLLEELKLWVEEGVAPEYIMTTGFLNSSAPGKIDCIHGVDFQRPVYAYPYETKYIGGNTRKPDSFCRGPEKRGIRKGCAERYLDA